MANIGKNVMSAVQGDALILCRTPFQAVVIKRVLIEEEIKEFDLVYLTQNNSEEDLHYYAELAAIAGKSQYVYIMEKKFDILAQVIHYVCINSIFKLLNAYRKVVVSSFDSLAFRKIVSKNRNAEVISFDDGTGYINKHSSYMEEYQNLRSLIYTKAFAVPGKREFIKTINRHYSVYRGFENIISAELVRFIDVFNYDSMLQNKGARINIFIGQPFDEYMDPDYIGKLRGLVYSLGIEYYIMHPRELRPLVGNIPILPKNGRIAEEAIFKICDGRRPAIFGGFSSVMFNISSDVADKVMILSDDNEEHATLAGLGKMAGCQILYV